MVKFGKDVPIEPIKSLWGSIVVSAFKGKDEKGYDILVLYFADNSTLVVEEQGQVGYFDVTHHVI